MAKANIRLIKALRDTAARLVDSKVTYRWSHFAHCNCGHLVQTITGLEPQDVQRRAMHRDGDWGQQATDNARIRAQLPPAFPEPDYGDRPALDEGAWEPENVGACTTTGTPLDVIFDQLTDLGLEPEDVGHLERLSDPAVRRRLGTNTTDFLHYRRDNVVAYLTAWADLLDEQLEETEVQLALAAE